MPSVQYRKFKMYSGPRVLGSEPFPPPSDRSRVHVARAFWLTAKVETGAKYGSVIAYDGTAMTAGLDQHIAVFPKELAHEDGNAKDDQGSLWKLLRRMEVVDGDASYRRCLQNLWNKLADEGWYVAQDGVLRYLRLRGQGQYPHVSPGDAVYGMEIRDVMTPMGGVVPRSGGRWVRAKEWALAFHELFSHPAGFKAQQHFGEDHLVERTKRRRRWKYVGHRQLVSVEATAYPADVTSLVATNTGGWSYAEDLAMCVYQSHSVNAPGKALRLLDKALSKSRGPATAPRRIIEALGTSSYGRWDDDLKTGRYQRTRSAARASGLWPRKLFDGPGAIMPKDLEG